MIRDHECSHVIHRSGYNLLLLPWPLLHTITQKNTQTELAEVIHHYHLQTLDIHANNMDKATV
jgi:hypothetical protein